MADTNDKPQDKPVTLSGQQTTRTNIQKEQESTPKSERIVEVTPGEFRTLKRMTTKWDLE